MSPDLMAFLWGPLAAGHWLLLRQATRVSFLDESRRTDLVNRTPNKGQTLAAFVVYFEGGQNHVIRYANGAVLPLCGAG